MNELTECNKYWVGPRKSDIQFANEHFRGELCLFSSDNDIFQLRINQNYVTDEMRKIIKNRLTDLVYQNPNIELYFYNQADAYKYGDEIIPYAKNINNPNLLMFLNDKILCKQWLTRHHIAFIH